MSSPSADNNSGGEDDTLEENNPRGDDRTIMRTIDEPAHNGEGEGRIVELLQEERESASTPQPNGTNRYKFVQQAEDRSEDGSIEAIPRRAGSPIDSLLSVPDDFPSVQVR